jgi:DNA-binding NarL/FixJ family response regulator
MEKQMERDNEVRSSLRSAVPRPLRSPSIDRAGLVWSSFRIVSRNPAVDKLVADGLEHAGFRSDPASRLIIVLDAPQGSALALLETLDRCNTWVIVATSSLVPEYLEDLWDLRPHVLLACDHVHRQLDHAIRRAANGESYRDVPDYTLKLTPTERATLRYVVRGWTYGKIAQVRNVMPRRVANTMNEVRAKLGVQTDVGAANYYWGRTDLG